MFRVFSPAKREGQYHKNNFTDGCCPEDALSLAEDLVQALQRMNPDFSTPEEARMSSSEVITRVVVAYPRLPIINTTISTYRRYMVLDTSVKF